MINKQEQNREKRNKGKEIETIVCSYLESQGLQLLQQNYTCKSGEIDLIFQQKKQERIIQDHQNHNKPQCVFVEVRYRKNLNFGTPAESIHFFKQNKLIKTAQVFLKLNPQWANNDCRFDVVSVVLQDQKPLIDWIPDAFRVS